MKKRDDIYLREMEARALKISSYLKKLSQARFKKSDLHRSAIIRELEVIGEAAGKVSKETREQFREIPWDQIIGMRNRLIHGYFDVDENIVWQVAKYELPKLLEPIRTAILITSPPIHPWRVCPSGYYFVRKHNRRLPDRSPLETSVRMHCRRNPSGRDQLYRKEIFEIMETAAKDPAFLGKIGKLKHPSYANDFDTGILMWTKYWNDIFSPKELLSPNVVKALLGSESSFNKNVRDVRVRGRNFARGPFQITDETRKILSDEKGELKDHFLTLSISDVKDPNIAVAAAIRWLFQKKKLASNFLKREATWEEAVAEYKSYLRGPKSYKEAKGMKNYFAYMAQLESSE